MAELPFPLVVHQGSTYVLTIPVVNDAGNPISVTGWTPRGQIRSDHGAPSVLHELDLEVDDTSVSLHIPADDSSSWTFRAARYDVEITSPDGVTTSRLLEGPVVVRAEITRD